MPGDPWPFIGKGQKMEGFLIFSPKNRPDIHRFQVGKNVRLGTWNSDHLVNSWDILLVEESQGQPPFGCIKPNVNNGISTTSSSLVSRISAINSPIIPAPPLCLRQLPQDVQLILSHVQLGCCVGGSGGELPWGSQSFCQTLSFQWIFHFWSMYIQYILEGVMYIPFFWAWELQ